MTKPTLEFEAGELGAMGSAHYDRDELALVYASDEDLVPRVAMRMGRLRDRRLSIYDRPVFLIADTLTLRFDEDRVLVALDAYTNMALWKHEESPSVVEVAGTGRLKVQWNQDEDRVALAVVPRFIFASDLKRLRIYFGSNLSQPNYFNVCRDVVVGLSDGSLTEIILLNVEMS